MSSSSDINKICNDDSSSKSNDDVVCEVSDMLQNMSTADNEDNDILVCANCGKEGSDVNNICNKCKQVKYCNASCKKRHRHKHKIQCEEHVRLATEKHNEELRIAAELHDEKLFKEPPPLFEDCPICFVRMPTLSTGSRYQTCCGKVICSGCFYAPVFDNQGNEVENRKCAFCRVPTPLTHEEAVERDNKRMKDGHVDAHLIHSIGIDYRDGKNGFPQDYKKALELWHRAAPEMGCNKSYNNVGYAYKLGRGVEIDKKKAKYYFELAAMRGNVNARFSLGIEEDNAGRQAIMIEQ